MNKHMKKFISVLITASMALASMTFAYAADDDTASTETTETTEAATATAAPASTSFDDDDYYQESVDLLQKLGIIVGDDSGNVNPDQNITRTEMATIVLRILKVDATTYKGIFADVANDFWGASIIQSAADSGIIAGYGDGNFGPNDEVLYEQVAKMLVCAINYQQFADNQGGYPYGYLTVAAAQDITKNATGTTGVAAPRGLVIKMVYNTILNADYAKATKIINGVPQYEYNNDYTIASDKFDLYKIKGQLLATSTKSLLTKTPVDGQIYIDSDEDDGDEILVDTDLKDIDDLVGIQSKIFYQVSSDGEYNVVAIIPLNNKSKTLEIDATDIESVNSIGTDNASIEYKPDAKSSKTKTEKIAKEAKILYNGQAAYTADGITSEAATRIETDGITIEELLTPVQGKVTLIDNDNDNKYDVVSVEKYEIMLVTTANDTKVVGYVNGRTTTIDVDTVISDKTITVIKAGDEVKTKNLKKDDVASVKRNLDNSYISIEVPGEKITGTITRMADDDGDLVITVDGTKYTVDPNVYVTYDSDGIKSDNRSTAIRLDSDAEFTFDSFGRIGNIEYTTTTGGLEGKEKYGWVVKGYIDTDEGENDVTVRLYDVETAKFINLKTASKVNFWAPNATEPVNKELTVEDVERTTNDFGQTDYVTAGSYSIKICKYETNSSGELTKLYLGISNATAANADGSPVVVQTTVATRQGVGTVMDGKYTMVDGITELWVPNIPAKISNKNQMITFDTDIKSFSTGSVIASNYLPRESAGQDTVVVDWASDTKQPGLVLRFNSDPNATDTSMDDDGFTANSHPTFMLNSISAGVDDDGNSVYYLSGYEAGTEVEYVTIDTSAVYDMSASIFSDRQYSKSTIWTAREEGSTYKTLDNYLNEGDILLINNKGTQALSILRTGNVTQMEENKKFAWTDGVLSSYNSSSRNGWFQGDVLSIDIQDNVIVTAGNDTNTYTWSIDPSAPITVAKITLDSDGNVISGSAKVDTESINASDLTESQGLPSYDKLVVFYHRGAIVDIYAYRFE